MFDIFIRGFVIISVAAFVTTQDKHEKKENVQVQRETDTGN